MKDMHGINPLQKQLEEQRYLHGVAYVEQSAGGLKILSTSEVAHLNQILTGESEDPWRFEPISIRMASGKTHFFNVHTNPILLAREVIGEAMRLAGNQELVEGALHLYSQFVISHLFKDANRRTAILATLWLFESHGKHVNARELADFSVGDLREESDLLSLHKKLKELAK